MLPAPPFILRPYESSDAAQMSAGVRESMETVGKCMSWAKADFSEYDALCWFAQCNEARASGEGHEFGIFAADGKFVGGCGLNQISKLNKVCNLGYWVRQSAQRQGAASAATTALLQLAFKSLSLERVEIVVAQGNEPSLAVARKTGGTYECLAQNKLRIHGKATASHVFSFVPRADA
jgi:ribosomal-protein-serine acetyltransferase